MANSAPSVLRFSAFILKGMYVYTHKGHTTVILLPLVLNLAGVSGLPGSTVKLDQTIGSAAVDDSSRKREVRLMKNRCYIIVLYFLSQ